MKFSNNPFLRLIKLSLFYLILASALLVLSLRWFNPPTTAFMLASDQPIVFEWLDSEQISAHLHLALISSEDQRFPDHHGFDFTQQIESIKNRMRGKSLRGASTISQQTVKNLFLWRDQSWLRKGIEAYLTVLLELFIPKERILELYINIAQFSPTHYGAKAASEHFFKSKAQNLSVYQASLLAAVLPRPNYRHQSDLSTNLAIRSKWIRQQMRNLGGIHFLRRLKGKEI